MFKVVKFTSFFKSHIFSSSILFLLMSKVVKFNIFEISSKPSHLILSPLMLKVVKCTNLFIFFTSNSQISFLSEFGAHYVKPVKITTWVIFFAHFSAILRSARIDRFRSLLINYTILSNFIIDSSLL